MEKKAYLEIAKIINTHGVRGAVKLDPWCDTPETLKKIKKLYLENGTAFDVSNVKMINGGFVVLSLSGVETVEDAVKLKNKILLAKREDIPLAEGAHFICDLIGMPVKDAETGKIYGTLLEVTQPALQELYVVKTENGNTVMVPNVPAFIHHIDEEAIYMTPIGGFFDDDSVEA
ncbi:MAG: 16S rRNA processing protein RimM [Clostridia bacterium]|nr:16S rRNA processing protein RimM [Clostridia bacterium]